MEAYSLKDKEKRMETSSTRVYGPLLFLFFFFFIRFYFLFFSPPFFFVSRRDRSTSVSFCSPPFFFIYLPLSPYNHPRTNEERTITFCFRLEDLLPPEPLDSSTVFCLHFNRPSATFHANILASSNNIVPLVSFHAPCSWLAGYIPIRAINSNTIVEDYDRAIFLLSLRPYT